MIRREIAAPDGSNHWLLISQVHHAHVSGELTRHWRETFSPDVVDAISHHDDGWAEWEAAPKLNTENGKPYSFLEMPLTDALAIWDGSIASARKDGPLAGYIVAGHFYNLLNESEHAGEGPAVAWLTSKRKLRTAWIDEWLRADASHQLDYAKRSQQMLLVADLLSLWLCCDCPFGTNQVKILSESSMKLRTDTLLRQFQFEVRDCMVGVSERSGSLSGISWFVAMAPFPFLGKLPVLSLKALAVSARHYPNWEALMAAAWTVELQWRIEPLEPAASSAR